MRGTIVNTILFIIVIALLGLNWALRSDPSRRNIEIMPDMAQSPAYASFGANENFRDGMTLRGPVPGTVIPRTDAAPLRGHSRRCVAGGPRASQSVCSE